MARSVAQSEGAGTGVLNTRPGANWGEYVLSNDSDTKTSLALVVTPRQAEVLRLIATGLSDKQIASRLGVSPRTVQSHVDRIYLQNGLHKRTALIAAWVREHPG